MLAPTLIVHDPPCLLADVRVLLSARPALADYPGSLTDLLVADERDVVLALEALEVEGEVLV